MIVHIVLFKWKKDASNSEIDSIIEDIRALRHQVHGIIGLRSGHNFSESLHEYTHALVVSFKDKESLETYRTHPDHLKIVERIEKIEENIFAVDFEDHS